MKEIISEYKNELKQLFNSKRYMYTLIIVAILSYGFVITHTTIGMDDTCLDRYYGSFFSVNMIAAGRWGSYLLYKLLGITRFTPFWLELITTCIFAFTAIVISCFIRKNIKKNDLILSTIFSCLYISYSLINEPYIFQPSNLALILGNLLVIACVMAIYEMFFNYSSAKKINYLLLVPIIAIAISFYESCCQTFLLGLLICIIIRIIIYKENDKNILKFFFIGIAVLVLGIILNYVILYAFYLIGIPNSLSGGRSIYWFEYGLINGINILANNIRYYIFVNIRYLPVLEFSICMAIGLILSVIYSIKNKNIYIFNVYILMVFSNFALAILQCREIMYRACISWSLFVAVIITCTYFILARKKYLKIISTIFVILIILWQTRDLNQWFYSEYLKYQKDLNDAYQIAYDIKKEVKNIRKPIVFVGIPDKGSQVNGQIGAQSNGLSVVWWGQKAFEDNSYELIKFINLLGYHYNKPTDEQYERGIELSEGMENYPKEGYIKEFQEVIVVKFSDV